MKHIWLALTVSLPFSTYAYDGFSSELGHAAGGALLSGAVTRLFAESEHRAWIGFAVSASGIMLAERSGLRSKDPIKVKSSRLDVTYHIVGAALGAWVTDRYILQPVLSPSYVGVVFMRDF